MKPNFSIKFLDHVAIRVNDLEASANWYEEILGLRRVQPKEWKPWPIFMLAGNSGIALFPKNEKGGTMVDHFAFRISIEEYDNAREQLATMGIKFQEQDHHYFKSVYFSDPDKHTVELTEELKALS